MELDLLQVLFNLMLLLHVLLSLLLHLVSTLWLLMLNRLWLVLMVLWLLLLVMRLLLFLGAQIRLLLLTNCGTTSNDRRHLDVLLLVVSGNGWHFD